jgi:hypothetical protein
MNYNADWKPAVAVAAAFIILIAGVKLNDIYFAWLRRNYPGTMRRRRPPIIILAICFLAVVTMLLIFPPSEITKIDPGRTSPR